MGQLEGRLSRKVSEILDELIGMASHIEASIDFPDEELDIIKEEAELIAISQKGQVIRTPLADVPTLGRATQGVRIMKLNDGDKIASITTL